MGGGMTIPELLGLVAPWGPSGVLAVLILWAGFKGLWVWGRELTKAEKRADKFEQLAIGNLHIARTATDAIESERAKGGQG